jgi:hypothetical protein
MEEIMLLSPEHLEIVVPTLMSILAVVFFTEKTRWLCYGIVSTAIAAEVIMTPFNLVALCACVACFAGLLFFEHRRVNSPGYVLSKQ